MDDRIVKSAKIVEVIETISVKGVGNSADPVRDVHSYWSKDGVLLAERDTLDCEKEA